MTMFGKLDISTMKHLSGIFCIYAWVIWYTHYVHQVDTADYNMTKNGQRQPDMVHLVYKLIYAFVAFTSLINLPRSLMNLWGWTVYNGFADLTSPAADETMRNTEVVECGLPTICFRFVTRGNYPQLSNRVTEELVRVCESASFNNYTVEIVVDGSIAMELPNWGNKVTQILVPQNYSTPKGTLFKARALCFANEPGQSQVPEDAWIVHLDEESRITPPVLVGILEFCSKCSTPQEIDDTSSKVIGSALCYYEYSPVHANVLTFLLDTPRIGSDLGCYRIAMHDFGKPIFGLRGSYHIIQAKEERELTYDVGRWGSLAEDYTLAMIASSNGYKFDFVRGFGSELAAFTIFDLIKQRKRWTQGKLTVLGQPGFGLLERLFVLYHAVSLTQNLLMCFNWLLILCGYPVCCALPRRNTVSISGSWLFGVTQWAYRVTVYPYLADLPGRRALLLLLRFNYAVFLSEAYVGLMHNFHSFPMKSPWSVLSLVFWTLFYYPVRMAFDTLSCVWALKDILKTDEFYVIAK